MGTAWSQYSDQTFPPKSEYSVGDIPDLTGKVVIVTGANTGVGKETAKALLAHNAKVYIAARSQEKAEAAIRELRGETGKEANFLQLDLADLKSVRRAAEEFQSKEKELHILFNNAGVMVPPLGQVTAQGYDLQWGTNVLGHFYFTKLLLPTLSSTAKSSPSGSTRVVHTSSSVSISGAIDFNTFKDGPARQRSSAGQLYAQSKLGNIIVSNEVSRRYKSEGVIFTSVNPGNLNTDLQRHLPWLVKILIAWIMLYPAPMGALTQLWAGTSDAGLELNGKFLIPWARVGAPNPLALDEKLGKEVWTWLEEQIESV